MERELKDDDVVIGEKLVLKREVKGAVTAAVRNVVYAKQPALESAGFPDTVQAFPQQARFLRPCLPGRPLHHKNI